MTTLEFTRLAARQPAAYRAFVLGLALLGTGCASTSVEFAGAPPTVPICQTAGERIDGLVVWGPRWRADQKEPARREAAAEQGIGQHFASSHCFARTEVRRVAAAVPLSADELRALASGTPGQPRRLVVIAVRELGPVLSLLASGALVEGGTEVLLDITVYDPDRGDSRRDFTVHWRNGGPGVVKGVTTLPDDIQSALAQALQPPGTRR
jgi:hypothetical protein